MKSLQLNLFLEGFSHLESLCKGAGVRGWKQSSSVHWNERRRAAQLALCAPPVFIRSWSSPTFGCLVLRRLLIFERVYQNLWKFDLFSSPVRPDGSYWHNLDLIKVSHEFFKNPKISLVWSHVKTRTLNRRLRQCNLYPKNTKASILFPKNGLNCE